LVAGILWAWKPWLFAARRMWRCFLTTRN